ncbi:MBOAT family O-acyltransferase [Tsuneonella troitsensis]|uniref:MBOAT family O-acyltransferase n=1 Tax=Tsuneonella troitsensis TaxID=292222 RepID=UPI000709BF64|nr:MBOAT family O-acyltransferase [Tsuneonella troitsensis]
MLFNSAPYLFAFLPLSLVAFYLLAKVSRDAAKIFVIAASLFFYSWISAKFLPLLIGSVVVNYVLGRAIILANGGENFGRAALLRNVGVLGNLALLVYFKYTNFLIENVNVVTDANIQALNVILPLGISFFTFQRISYLIDCARGEVQDGRFIDFAAVSVFFPQLISGPIILYGETKPQFANSHLGSRAASNLTVGSVIFAIGLFKKTVLADNAGYASDPVFDIIANGGNPGALAAWIAVLAYTVQLYFDFSGYSDMAIGSARMFGIRLPLNFHSPLRANSIIEYWRRWHMTLNRFMVRYFLPALSLKLTRAAVGRRLGDRSTFFASVVLPVFLTFVVIGIWHGASWTYVLFGVLHASFVSINEVWRNARKRKRKRLGLKGAHKPAIGEHLFYHVITLLCVLAANIMFRSETVSAALAYYRTLFAFNVTPASIAPYRPELLLFVAVGWFIILALPNTQQILRAYRPAVNWNQWRNVALPAVGRFIKWRPNAVGLAACGLVLAASITAMIIEMSREPAQFIYFQF